MYDRPTLAELIEAARMHVETQVIPAIKSDPKLYYQTLVAINVLRVAEREVALRWGHLLAAWASLDALEGAQPMPTDPLDAEQALEARSRALCEAIRAGGYDEREAALVDHLMAVTQAQLETANPKFLQVD